ncbi:urea amidolyase family protein [Pseudarthrobacter sp. J75]|uniref:5-oxoprolinase subunit B/C family protein n=1 Tax=unclassified Pseudarthrobacter TaxID=2647000 RepID=UPI002E801EC6|nr:MULTISPECIES: urea amidolyase family protein [unclassified Pseudarthrobacter]MEE2523763.1 urea amidolyase family protein [Pseudarthrobacter sp. J47]MEE2529929.1 urea amidolyase family protein [Pseudarthrobacter sp. J75]
MTDGTNTIRVLSVRAAGSRAVLAELAGVEDVLALTAALRTSPLPGQEQVVPAATTVLVIAESAPAARSLRSALLQLELPPFAGHQAGAAVVINTVYDGVDLASVAEHLGLSTEAVIAAHSGQAWTAAFGGFAPGFAYLLGDGILDVPRLDSPRTSVPAGSVALAGQYSAVYPRSSPGGWQLIGHTDAVMWDLDRAAPALVKPGDTVQFRPVRELVQLGGTRNAGGPDAPAGPVAEAVQGDVPGQEGLRVLSAGLLSLIEDLGRPGFQDLGVPASGALDRASLRRANRLVGNESDAACLETVAGGLVVQAVGDRIVAVAGAPAPLTVYSPSGMNDGGAASRNMSRSVPIGEAFALLDGESLEIGAPASGFRSYLAVRGGINVQPRLGSWSADTLSGIGPSPVAARQLLPVGTRTASGVVGLPELQPAYPQAGTATELRVVPGPRDDWFADGALEHLCAQAWTVTPRSNRVGLRLSGEPLARVREGELASEGMVAGALQVPPDGQPVLFLADHPVTGGYPVIAVVAEEDLAMAAQIPLGGLVRFRVA